jgi:hypothetical protein
MTNPWYEIFCKIARKTIRDSSNEFLKSYFIKIYKSIIKRKKRHYINRKKEMILHLSKLYHKRLWRKFFTHKTKENNMILLKN